MRFWGKGFGDSRRRGSHAFVHAEQQLQAHSDACVPSEGKDADVTRHDRRPQEVLHRRGAVRVSIKHLRRERSERMDYIRIILMNILLFHNKATTVTVGAKLSSYKYTPHSHYS